MKLMNYYILKKEWSVYSMHQSRKKFARHGRGSLTLCFSFHFLNPLQHSPLRLIFLSNFKILLVIVCHCVV